MFYPLIGFVIFGNESSFGQIFRNASSFAQIFGNESIFGSNMSLCSPISPAVMALFFTFAGIWYLKGSLW